MKWEKRDGYEELVGETFLITLQPRPHYCDRGNYLASLFPGPRHQLPGDLDGSDGWPRYYFDYARAKLEIEAWVQKRKWK